MKTLIIPTGTYNITGTLSLPSNLIIKGDGAGVTILRFIIPPFPTINDSPNDILNAFDILGQDHVGIEDLTIQRYCTPVTVYGITTDGSCYFHNELYAHGNCGMNTADNIYFNQSSECWVTGVESDNAIRHHVAIEQSHNITISGCYFNDVQNRGRGGFGYGVLLKYFSYQCLVENNICRRNRHGIVLEDESYNNVRECNAFFQKVDRSYLV